LTEIVVEKTLKHTTDDLGTKFFSGEHEVSL